MRYDQLLTIVDEIKPRVIVEVGVARAERAVAMCRRALKHVPTVLYYGYDVFDTKDAAFHRAAFNLKKVDSRDQCAARLDAIKREYPLFEFSLIVGDTRATLHPRPVKADLAFIDGDHRAEAIAADYAALKNSPVIVLDDYYVADEHGCPDVKLVGCNKLVDGMNGKVVLMPASDQVRGGGQVKMAIVRCFSGDV